jgi:16S rRNA (cytidine1402-2'-O)-methyltransferase
MGTLYIVATPIGNLEDITLRAVRILREVTLIAAEDTRKSGLLLAHLGIETPMTSYFEHNKISKLERILTALTSGDVALISEAGTPGISDPGYELIHAVLAEGYPVVPIPGASAVISALSAGGLPTQSFTFVGFLPRKGKTRQSLLAHLATVVETVVFYEAPHRIRETVDDLLTHFGADRQIVLARELTKRFEEFWRGTIADAIGHLEVQEPRGEYTVLVAGIDPADQNQRWEDDDVQKYLLSLEADGITGARAVKEVVQQSGRPKAEVYALWLQLRDTDAE